MCAQLQASEWYELSRGLVGGCHGEGRRRGRIDAPPERDRMPFRPQAGRAHPLGWNVDPRLAPSLSPSPESTVRAPPATEQRRQRERQRERVPPSEPGEHPGVQRSPTRRKFTGRSSRDVSVHGQGIRTLARTAACPWARWWWTQQDADDGGRFLLDMKWAIASASLCAIRVAIGEISMLFCLLPS